MSFKKKQTSQNEEETLETGSASVGSSLQELAQKVQDEKRDAPGMASLISPNTVGVSIILQFASSS